MSYAEAIRIVQNLIDRVKCDTDTMHGVLIPVTLEALEICKNAALECAARAAKK